MALKENYKDDILDVSVNTKRKYRMTENADGTISLEDETVYTQEGDSFGASDMNAMAHAINNTSSDAEHTSYDNTTSGLQATNVQDAVDEINDNLTASNQTAGVTDVPFRFGCTDDGKFGYIINQGGADSVIPFSSKAVLLWTNENPSNSFVGQTLNIANLSDYDTIIICTRYRTDRSYVGYEFFPTNVLSGYSLYSLLCIDTTYRTVARSGNQLTFSSTQKGGNTDNTYNIPLEIYGLKNDILD